MGAGGCCIVTCWGRARVTENAACRVFNLAGAFQTVFIGLIGIISTSIATGRVSSATVGITTVVSAVLLECCKCLYCHPCSRERLRKFCASLNGAELFLVLDTVVDVDTACICTSLSATVIYTLGIGGNTDIDDRVVDFCTGIVVRFRLLNRRCCCWKWSCRHDSRRHRILWGRSLAGIGSS